jgi:hypothetical protein
MKVNTYGMKMNGIRKASEETEGLQGYYSGGYLQISYNEKTGDILTNYHFCFGHYNWSEYDDPNIITVCNFYEPATMQEIANAIRNAVEYNRIHFAV